MKAYHEYLELHSYFARGEPRLSSADFLTVAAEFERLALRFGELSPEERGRLNELKALLYRDRP